MSSPRVCVAENLAIGADGKLRLAPWSVPRNVLDVMAKSSGDTLKLLETTTLPGRLMVDQKGEWLNNTPVDHMVRVIITRRWKRWVVSNPNAVQFRDRWSTAITPVGDTPVPAEIPVVSGIMNGQVGSAGDIGTNSVAEPNPGKYWHWWGTNSVDEWVGPVQPGETIRLHYRIYVWTPPPFSDNANNNSPGHESEVGWARIQLMAFPQQGKLVTG